MGESDRRWYNSQEAGSCFRVGMKGMVMQETFQVEESGVSGLGDWGWVVGFFTKIENIGGRAFGRWRSSVLGVWTCFACGMSRQKPLEGVDCWA